MAYVSEPQVTLKSQNKLCLLWNVPTANKVNGLTKT